MAGYSKTPLPKKLGIRAGHTVAMLHAPKGFPEDALVPLPEGVTLRASLRGTAPLDVVLLFASQRAKMVAEFERAKDRIAKNGGLWVWWPKKASGVATDLDEGAVRAFGLASGLVDNKVCAVDETWSGLRFVWRVTERP